MLLSINLAGNNAEAYQTMISKIFAMIGDIVLLVAERLLWKLNGSSLGKCPYESRIPSAFPFSVSESSRSRLLFRLLDADPLP